MGEKEVNTENIDSRPEEAAEETATLSGEGHPEAVDEQNEMEKLKAELREQKEKFLRLYADFENFRRVSSKERLETIQTAGKEVILGMLEVLDDMDRAEKQMGQQTEGNEMKEGFLLIFHKLRAALQNRGLKEMDCIGKDFNPDIHEAITELPSAGNEGKVIDQVEKGYLLNDKIIRFAKVVVGK